MSYWNTLDYYLRQLLYHSDKLEIGQVQRQDHLFSHQGIWIKFNILQLIFICYS